MGMDNIVFLEVIEWFDQSGQEMIHRIPVKGSGEIKWGAQLIVRESQSGILFYQGKAVHLFGPGRHTLKTGNIPILNKLMAIPWGLTSPLRAEVYFANLKVFANLKWGTREPVAFKDSELGLIRLRAYGLFNVRIIQPLLFINSLTGTMPSLTTENINNFLSSIIVSKFNDYLGEHLNSILNLPGKYDQWAEGLAKEVQKDLGHFGLGLCGLYINSITPPPEVQKAIDDRSKLSLFDDLDKLVKLKAASALEKAAENPGDAGQGLGLGLGLMAPGLLAPLFQQSSSGPQSQAPSRSQPGPAVHCPECKHQVPANASFCPYCGHQLTVQDRCKKCGKNLSVGAKFCPRCGTPVNKTRQEKFCTHCGTQNLSQAKFCNNCGEPLE